MIVRTLLLLNLVLQMRLNTIDATDDESENQGGEGFANIVQIVALLGLLALGVLIVLGILSLAGVFEMEFVDPEA